MRYCEGNKLQNRDKDAGDNTIGSCGIGLSEICTPESGPMPGALNVQAI